MKKVNLIERGVSGRAGGLKLGNGRPRYTSSLPGRLILFSMVFIFLSLGIFSPSLIGAKGAFAFEGYEDGASYYSVNEVLPYGCSAGDIYRLLFDFTMKYINGEMEPEMVLRTFFEIFLALEDGVLTEGEILVIINKIYAVNTIYL